MNQAINLTSPSELITNEPFSVKIIGDTNKINSSVEIKGIQITGLSWENIAKLGLTMEQCYENLNSKSGLPINNIFLSGEYYSKYNITPPQFLCCAGGGLKSITQEPLILGTEQYSNQGKGTDSWKVQFTKSESESLSDTTTSSNTISVGAKVSFEAGVGSAKVGGEISMSYSHQWGKSHTEEKTETIGMQNSVSIAVKPNMLAIATYTVQKTALVADVQYWFDWWGDYILFQSGDKLFRGSLFDMLIGSKQVCESQDVTFNYYTSGKLTHTDQPIGSTDKPVEKTYCEELGKA